MGLLVIGQLVSEDTCESCVATGHLESHTDICMKGVMSTLVHAHLQTVSMVRILFFFWPSGTLSCISLPQSASAVVTAQGRIVALGIRKMPHSQETQLERHNLLVTQIEKHRG